MAIEYLGLSSVNGPFVVLEGVRGAAYDEIVEIVAEGREKKLVCHCLMVRPGIALADAVLHQTGKAGQDVDGRIDALSV